MMLSMSAPAIADDPPDEVIQLNQKGIDVFQRVMLGHGFRCKVMGGYVGKYTANNYFVAYLNVKLANTQERAQYALMFKMVPEELICIWRFDEGDKDEPVYWADKALGAYIEREKQNREREKKTK